MEWYRVVETDNYGGDYPDEKFATPYHFREKEDAKRVADLFNELMCDSRYWKVVSDNYTLKPGFEP